MRAVVDTNVLISASLWSGPSARLLAAAENGTVELIGSPELLAEFAAVIARPKFAARIAAHATTGDALARKLAEKVTIVSPLPLPHPSELRDPNDLHVLECAIAARPDVIISGDEDLLTMRTFRDIPIINSREALRRLGVQV